MFGYVKAYAPELKVKDYNLYRAAYCGLCKSMGRCTGQCSRFTLSYDMVFLTLVRMGLTEEPYAVRRERCIAHPLKKRAVMQPNETLSFCARVSALLTDAKLADDIRDTRGMKRLAYRALRPFSAYARRRAALRELYGVIAEKLAALSECEEKRVASVDVPSALFGELTAAVFAESLDGAAGRLAEKIGFYTGKWIYAADALDDLSDDAVSGSYNPFLLLYGAHIPPESVDSIRSAFLQTLTEIEKALDLVTFTDASLKALIYNVLYEGMHRRSCEIADKITVTEETGEKS